MTWNWKSTSLWGRLLVALLIVTAASAFRVAFFGSLGHGIPYLLYFPAVTLAALYGGLLTGGLATILAAALVSFWIQHGSMSPVELMALAVFCISGLLTSGICEAMRRAQSRERLAQEHTEAANQELRREVAERQRAQEALREAKDHLENLIDYANAPIIVWDAEGKITRFNHAFEEIAGLKAEQVLGQGLEQLFAEDQRERAMGLVRRAGAGERFDLVEVPIRHASGAKRTVLWNSAPIFGADGKTQVATIAQGQDISQLKQAEAKLRESEEQFRTMANSMLQLAWIARADGHIFWYNRRWYEYTGTTPEQMEGWGWQSVHDPAVLPTVIERWKDSINNGQPFEMEFPLRGADGQFRTFLTRVQPLKDSEGRVVQWLGTNTDVEVLKQAEEKVARLNAELEQRVRDRTAQLETANEELEAFSYSVSHDLRAPLRHVLGYVEMLADEAGDQLSAEGRRFLKTIADASEEMSALIDDLLAFSRMGRAEMRETNVELGALVREALRGLESTMSGRNIVWKIPPLPVVQGDPAMLKQVFTNLLGNAVKYTRPRDPAEIEVACAGHEDGRIILCVRDNGVGFDPQYAHKLFGVFQRLHRADEFEGTGIGLANVRRIVARHAGRTWAEGKVNEGAAFYFTLRPSSDPIK